MIPSPAGADSGPPESARIVGWDIGGAHVKAALLDAQGRLLRVEQLACALWTGLEPLQRACDGVLQLLAPAPMLHAVTMTGEMADFFADRPDGVRTILDCIKQRLQARSGDALWVFAGARGFLAPDDAARHWESVASANWLATATCCARAAGAAVLVDIGSTTTDLVPCAGTRVLAVGTSDATRLEAGELVYAGIVRTPLAGLSDRAPVLGAWRPTINEHYATTADVFRVLGELDEACDLQASADNGPKSAQGSARRLLRMIGADLEPQTQELALALAHWYRECLIAKVVAGLHQRLSRGDVPAQAPLLGAGIGSFLVGEVALRMRRPTAVLASLLGAPLADPQLCRWAEHCAPAVAVARLAHASTV